jgi:hypothetical protein
LTGVDCGILPTSRIDQVNSANASSGNLVSPLVQVDYMTSGLLGYGTGHMVREREYPGSSAAYCSSGVYSALFRDVRLLPAVAVVAMSLSPVRHDAGLFQPS